MNFNPYVVGITGGSASGKTSFLEKLQNKMPDHLTVLSQDHYYLDIEHQARDENNEVNFDLPNGINKGQFCSDLIDLINGKSLEIKEYTFNNPKVTAQKIIINPKPIIVVEGLFILYFSEIKELLDLSIFIDAPLDRMLERRIQRDAKERGYGSEIVQYQWNNHVLPSFNKYLAPFREESDIIVTNKHDYLKGLEVVENHLIKKIKHIK